MLAFIALFGKEPIGYVQLYKVQDYPWSNQNLPEETIQSAAGMDLFIGDSSMIGQGFGGKIVHAFLKDKIWPNFQYCVVDPDVKNKAAIRCYEKLRFVAHGIIETVDAMGLPTKLKLMILKH